MPFDPAGWQEAVHESQGGEAPPDGLYDAEYLRSEVITRNSDGAQWLKLYWKCLAGAHRDEEWASLHTLERYKPDGDRNPGLAFTVDQLRKMGYDVDDPQKSSSASVIDRNMTAFEGTTYSVEVKWNGRFANTYVKGWLRAAQTHPAAAPASSYGQPPAQSLADQAVERRDIERTGESDVPSDLPWSPEYKPEQAAATATVDRDAAPKRGDVDPETGEEIPF